LSKSLVSKSKNQLANITVVFFSIILLSSSVVGFMPNQFEAYAASESSYSLLDGSGWSSPSSTKGIPDNACSTTQNGGDVLTLTGFDFPSISASDVINSVTIRIDAAKETNAVSITAQLRNGATNNGNTVTFTPSNGNCSNSAWLASQDPTSDSWTGTTIQNLQVTLTANGPTMGSARTHFIDAVEISVDYTPASSPTGTLTIVKNTVGGNGVFQFMNDTGSFSIDTTTLNTGNQAFVVPPGQYNITETVPIGWDLTSYSCTSGTNNTANTVNATVSADQTTTCTFINTKRGTLEIVKEVIGVSDGIFTFNNDTGSFDIDTSISDTKIISVPPGQYNITETIPIGWDLTSYSCTSGTNNTANTVNATVSAGQTTTCTFVNTERGILNITKNIIGFNDDTFTFINDTGSFDIITEGLTKTQTFIVPPGIYNITENITSGYDLTSYTCDNGTNSTENTVNATVVAGLTTICTFVNTEQLGVLNITKSVIGINDDTFTFNNDTGSFDIQTLNLSGNQTMLVPPGIYNITEVIPSGYDLTSYTCDNGTNSTENTVNATVVAGLTTTCDFVNTERGILNITKATLYDDGTFTFNNDTGSFDIQTLNLSGNQTMLVPPGIYNITEMVDYDWVLESYSCDNGSNSTLNTVNATVLPGGTTNCLFYNEPATDLLISKNGTAYVHPNGLITYYINVTNQGPHDAYDVKVYDLMDPDTNYFSSSTVTGSYDQGNDIWNIGKLDANLSAILQLVVSVDSDAEIGYLNNTAIVNSTTHEIDNSDNTDSALSAVLPNIWVTNGGNILGFDFNSTSIDTKDFRIIYTPDPLDISNFTLSSTTPGQFFAHAFYIGEPNTDATMNVTIPGPFVSQGTNWIHTYGDVEIIDDGFVPLNGVVFTSSNTSITGINGSEVQINGTTSDNGLFYARIHLDYGLKKTPNYMNAANHAINSDSAKTVYDHSEYMFEIDASGVDNDGVDSIYNLNVFKNPRGVLGLTTDDISEGHTVELFRSEDDSFVASAVTDENGYAFIDYQHKGKASDYYLHSDDCTVNSPDFTLGGKYKYQYAELSGCSSP